MMSIECSECERDARGGHDESCSRHPDNKMEVLMTTDNYNKPREAVAEPFKYLVQRFSEGMHEKDEYLDSKESAYENARCGFNETKVIPLYTSQPNYEALLKENERLKALSVTNVMINIVPDLDGNGFEVYAKSVDEVENLLSEMGLELEDKSDEVKRLRDALAKEGER